MVKICKFVCDDRLYKEMLGEFFGTFILVSFTVGAAAQATFSAGLNGSCITNMFCSGIAVMMAVQVAGNVSGAHVNPAVSFAMTIIGKFKWQKLPFYMLSQYCGACVGGAFVYAAYQGAGDILYGQHKDLASAAIWTSFPGKHLHIGNAIFDCVASSSLLMILNLSVTETENMGLVSGQYPFFLGLVVTTIGSGYSLNAGNPMNPAKDFGTRMFLALVGWNTQIFEGPSYTWWWIPLVAPHFGTVCGALLYLGLIHTKKITKDSNAGRPCGTLNIIRTGSDTKEEDTLISTL